MVEVPMVVPKRTMCICGVTIPLQSSEWNDKSWTGELWITPDISRVQKKEVGLERNWEREETGVLDS